MVNAYVILKGTSTIIIYLQIFLLNIEVQRLRLAGRWDSPSPWRVNSTHIYTMRLKRSESLVPSIYTDKVD